MLVIQARCRVQKIFMPTVLPALRRLSFTLRYWQLRLSEKYNELRFGVQSDGLLTPSQLWITNPDSIEYAAVPYRVLSDIFNKLSIRGGEEVFLDMGCGMGRPLIVAAQHPFRRVLGVELSQHLCDVAKRNVDAIRPRALCQDIRIEHSNAVDYTIPDDVTVIFFYNPFRGETLRKVIENIRQSLLRKPRLLRIVYHTRVFFDEETAEKHWIQKRLHYPCFPRASWALYEADVRSMEYHC